jgi:DNA-binding IclR family transcriptional regulator
VSLEPPLILWSQARQAGSYGVFQRAREFAISILAEDQFEVSSRFATRREDKFEGVEVDREFCGLPVIAGSSAWLHCRTVSQVDGGDHTIYIGEILKIARGTRRPLVFGGGQYLLAQPHHAALPATTAIPGGARQRHALRLCTPWMQQVAEETDVTICAAVWGNCGPTIVAWESGPSSMLPAFPLGLVLPVTGSASGKAFAADLPADVVAPLVERELQGASGRDAPASRDAWSATLAQVRASRLAQHPPTRFWNHDLLITAASVAVRDRDGQAIVTMTAVVDCSLPADLLAKAIRRVQAAALNIERQLGFPALPPPFTGSTP